MPVLSVKCGGIGLRGASRRSWLMTRCGEDLIGHCIEIVADGRGILVGLCSNLCRLNAQLCHKIPVGKSRGEEKKALHLFIFEPRTCGCEAGEFVA
jgi:hypothetical protein